MRTALFTLVFVVSLTSAAQARIGETPDQLVARYGQPLKETDQKGEGAKIPLANVSFQKGGFQIDVTITNGVSTQEIFHKINGQPITIPEARLLLGANAQGRDWSAPHKDSGTLTWVRDDNATAVLGTDGWMTIRSQELVEEEAHAKRLEQRPSLDGF